MCLTRALHSFQNISMYLTRTSHSFKKGLILCLLFSPYITLLIISSMLHFDCFPFAIVRNVPIWLISFHTLVVLMFALVSHLLLYTGYYSLVPLILKIFHISKYLIYLTINPRGQEQSQTMKLLQHKYTKILKRMKMLHSKYYSL